MFLNCSTVALRRPPKFFSFSRKKVVKKFVERTLNVVSLQCISIVTSRIAHSGRPSQYNRKNSAEFTAQLRKNCSPVGKKNAITTEKINLLYKQQERTCKGGAHCYFTVVSEKQNSRSGLLNGCLVRLPFAGEPEKTHLMREVCNTCKSAMQQH